MYVYIYIYVSIMYVCVYIYIYICSMTMGNGMDMKFGLGDWMQFLYTKQDLLSTSKFPFLTDIQSIIEILYSMYIMGWLFT